VIPLLHELSKDAAAIGAVNTVVLRGGRWIGHNTDWWGFAEGFRRGLAGVKLRRVVQLGCGGAGAAVAHALLTLGVGELVLTDVDAGRAEVLAASLLGRFGAGRAIAAARPDEATRSAEGVVNATPIGMHGHPGLPLAPELLRSDLWVAEVVYFPLATELLRRAREVGCRTLDGGGMAVFQAVRAFELFSGVPADADRMARHFAAMG
jgi:shikimate dehydrogenase